MLLKMQSEQHQQQLDTPQPIVTAHPPSLLYFFALDAFCVFNPALR
jgi:hypothetical protein